MKTNRHNPSPPILTHEGGRAARTTLANQLRRVVMCSLLWEDQFYISGKAHAEIVADLVPKVDPREVAEIAIEAREQMKLRHIPLFLVREMVRHPSHRGLVAGTLERVIQRADEMAEFLALYWRDAGIKKSKRSKGNGGPVPSSVKRGLAAAFTKFDEYALSKYNRDADVKLRDVMFLVHPKPENKEQEALFKRVASDALTTPDTWETELSAGKDKKETFRRLMLENKLGAMALLRNLRNMTEAQVSPADIREGLSKMKADRVLPFRFISAAKYAPQFEPELEAAMFKCLDGAEKLGGRSLLVIDVSGSMTATISGKSELSRIDAACGLAILLREVCESVDVYTFAADAKQVPARRGFALRDAIMKQFGGSTRLNRSLTTLGYGKDYNRVIVITDGQTEDGCGAPKTKGYMLNVAAYQNGVGYGTWTTVDGWSESIVRFISSLEGGE